MVPSFSLLPQLSELRPGIHWPHFALGEKEQWGGAHVTKGLWTQRSQAKELGGRGGYDGPWGVQSEQ